MRLTAQAFEMLLPMDIEHVGTHRKSHPAIICSGSQPRNSQLSSLVRISHQTDLLSLFRDVVLVNADCIHPELGTGLVARSEMNERRMQIRPDMELRI